MDGRANQLVLALQSFRENLFVESRGNQIVVRRALACQNCATHVNERENDGRLHTLVFGLDVIDHAVVFNICVVSSDHLPS